MTHESKSFLLACQAVSEFMSGAIGVSTFKVIEMSMKEATAEGFASDALELQMRYHQIGFLIAEGRLVIEEAAALARAAVKSQNTGQKHRFLKFIGTELSAAKIQELLIADRRRKFAASFKKEGQEIAIEERRRATDFSDALLSDVQSEFGNSTSVMGIDSELSALVESRCNEYFSARLLELHKRLVRHVENVSKQANRTFPKLNVFPQHGYHQQHLELKQPSLRQTTEGVLREIHRGQFNWSVLGLTPLGRWMGALDATRAYRVQYAQTQRPAISTYLRDSRNEYAKLISRSLERFGKYLSGNIQTLVEFSSCRANNLERILNGEPLQRDWDAMLRLCDQLKQKCCAAYAELIVSCCERPKNQWKE